MSKISVEEIIYEELYRKFSTNPLFSSRDLLIKEFILELIREVWDSERRAEYILDNQFKKLSSEMNRLVTYYKRISK